MSRVNNLDGSDRDVLSRLNSSLTCKQTALQEAFEEADVNGDGSVNQEEFFVALGMVGVSVSENAADEKSSVKKADAEQLLTCFDSNGDGKLQYDEFMSLLR